MNRLGTSAFVAALILAVFLTQSDALAKDDGYVPLPGGAYDQTSGGTRNLSPEEALEFANGWVQQGITPNTDKVVDTVVSIFKTASPPVGALLGFASSLLGTGDGSDATSMAIQKMQSQITMIEQDIDQIEQQMNALYDLTAKTANYSRTHELKDRQQTVDKLTRQLKLGATDPNTRSSYEIEAQTVADRFLDTDAAEQDLWEWNTQAHVHIEPGHAPVVTLMQPSFSPMPTLQYYLAALSVWILTIQNEGKDPKSVIRDYGPKLLEHAKMLSVRPYWRELEETPITLPERLMAGITCEREIVSKYPDASGQCTWQATCNNNFAEHHLVWTGGSGEFRVPGGNSNTLCTLPGGLLPPRSASQQHDLDNARRKENLVYGTDAMATVEPHHSISKEDEIENRWGLQAMTLMADNLVRLARTGSLKDPYVGQFDMTFWNGAYALVVNQQGELIEYLNYYGDDRNGPKQQGPVVRAIGSATAPPVVHRTSAPLGKISAVSQRGKVRVADAGTAKIRPDLKPLPPLGTTVTPKWLLDWDQPKTIANGWGGFRDVFPASTGRNSASLFALTPEGALKWYRSDGFFAGNAKVTAPVDVGGDWNQYEKIFAGGDGILYGITHDGSLKWYRYADSVADASPQHLTGPFTVNTGWSGLVDAFADGSGVVYVVKSDGTLLWYRHTNYQTGIDPPPRPGVHVLGKRSAHWQGPKVVGNGWQNFRKIVALGNGVILAVQANGEVLWYHHSGFRDGTPKWEGPINTTQNWADAKIVIPVFPGVASAPVN
jgi:hypothetical protein